ncbi:MAG: hypothetical protein EBU66_13440 [Bacteroidetes bacterium]|nr:hypothetical protein [bacterium]NBP65649.1 hypothetical protein [Bacteroidota bacterium]
MALFLFFSGLSICFSQQNFFNVPSSDITPEGGLFFQQQCNFLSSSLQFNTTFSYGLGNSLEAGINILGLTKEENGFVINDSSVPYAPLFCFNAQKKFQLSEYASLSTGGQLGLNMLGSASTYLYANSIYHVVSTKTKCIVGIYYTSDGFFGDEQRSLFTNGILRYVGFQFGFEQHLLHDKLVFQSDLITGKHDLGENVTGLAYFLTERWILSAGYQLPLFNSTSKDAVVIELTYAPD